MAEGTQRMAMAVGIPVRDEAEGTPEPGQAEGIPRPGLVEATARPGLAVWSLDKNKKRVSCSQACMHDLFSRFKARMKHAVDGDVFGVQWYFPDHDQYLCSDNPWQAACPSCHALAVLTFRIMLRIRLWTTACGHTVAGDNTLHTPHASSSNACNCWGTSSHKLDEPKSLIACKLLSCTEMRGMHTCHLWLQMGVAGCGGARVV